MPTGIQQNWPCPLPRLYKLKARDFATQSLSPLIRQMRRAVFPPSRVVPRTGIRNAKPSARGCARSSGLISGSYRYPHRRHRHQDRCPWKNVMMVNSDIIPVSPFFSSFISPLLLPTSRFAHVSPPSSVACHLLSSRSPRLWPCPTAPTPQLPVPCPPSVPASPAASQRCPSSRRCRRGPWGTAWGGAQGRAHRR